MVNKFYINRFAHIFYRVLFFGFLGLFLQVSSLEAADVKIGFIDIQKALAGTLQWKKEFNSFKSNFEKEKVRIAARENKIKKMLEDLNKQSFVLDPELKKKKEEEFRKEKRDFERYVQDRNEDFAKKEKEITNRMLIKMMQAVDKIGKEKGYTMILEQKVGLYYDKNHDLTALATRTYDRMK